MYIGADLCIITGTENGNESWVNRQFRRHYEDSSSCGAPDYSDYIIEPAKACPSEPDEYECCRDWFGNSTCYTYFENWHCF